MTNSELIEAVKSRLINAYNPEVIYLFGSYAWGKPDEQSDLDLLVIVKSSDEKSYKRPVKGIRSLRGMKVPKDIIVYTIKEFKELSSDVSSLCYKVKKEGIKLYEAA